MPGAPPHTRQRRVVNGVLYLQCSCELHRGKWLPWWAFGKAYKGGYPKAKCRRGYALYHAKRRYPHRQNHGRVQIEKVRPYLTAIIEICGSYNTAARTMGISQSTMYRWMHKLKPYTNYVMAETAAQILLTLQGLKKGYITPNYGKRGKLQGHHKPKFEVAPT